MPTKTIAQIEADRQAAIVAHDQEDAAVNAVIASLQSQLVAANTSIGTLTSQSNSLSQQLAAALADDAADDAQIASLLSQVTAGQAQLSQAQANLAAALADDASDDAYIAELEAEVERLRDLYEAVDPTITVAVLSKTDTSVMIQWSVDPGTHDVSGVYISKVGGTESGTLRAGLAGQFNFTGLTASTSYSFDVDMNVDGARQQTNALVGPVTTNGASEVPATVAIKFETNTDDTITISWVINPGTKSIVGSFQGREAVGSLPFYRSTNYTAGLTGSRVYDNLPTNVDVTMFVEPVTTATGTGTRTSITARTGTAPVAQPTVTTAPTMKTAKIGQPLAYNPGAYTGSPSVSYFYTLGGVNKGADYTPVTGDLSKPVFVTEVATNAGGSLNTASASIAVAAAAPAGGTLPAGYTKRIYERDFTVANAADDNLWTVTTGTQGNNRGTFLASQVVKSGPNGRVLTAALQGAPGSQIKTGGVKLPSVQWPQEFYYKMVMKFTNASLGAWFSSWLRPHTSSSQGEGEIDFLEFFASHIADWSTGEIKSGFARALGGTIILTPYGSKVLIQGSLDAKLPKAKWSQDFTLEAYKTLTKMEIYIDGQLACTLSRPSANGALWDAQMASLGTKWYYREDLQTGNVSGHTEAGEPATTNWTASQATKYMLVAAP